MPLPGRLSWKSIVAWGVVALAAAALMVDAAKQPTSLPSRPQPAVIVSDYFTPMAGGMSGGCATGGVVATVRLNNGQIVRAATYQYGYGIVHDGALVTVQKFRVLCGPAPYTILHGGPPDVRAERSLRQRAHTALMSGKAEAP